VSQKQTAMTNATQQQQHQKKVDNTVFVRFVPPTNVIRRHHVEDLFSQCGPIKKSSIIHTTAKQDTTDVDDEFNHKNDTNITTNTTTPATTTSSYGFVKYTTPEDAELASIQLQNRIIKIDGVSITVKVELAKKQIIDHETVKNKNKKYKNQQQQHDHDHEDDVEIDNNNKNDHDKHHLDDNISNEKDIKKTNRLILRNLSFYAKESDIRNALQPFGNIIDIHIPKVIVDTNSMKSMLGNDKKSSILKPTHRGFAFVTFENEKDAELCIQQHSSDIIIKERVVQISQSLHKTAYTQLQQSSNTNSTSTNASPNKKQHTKTTNDMDVDDVDENEEEEEDNDEEEDEDDNESETDENGDDDRGTFSSKKVDKDHKEQVKDDNAITEGRCLFVRNLPFDCTRHDIFETFRTFGYVTSIFIVKTEAGNNTTLPKGTAFVTFQKQDHAKKALESSKASTTTTITNDTTNFISQRTATTVSSDNTLQMNADASSGGIVLKGRRLLVDVAVDKETASTLTGSEKNADKIGFKDRRNLYLKNEGRVDNNESKGLMIWDELPENDKLKRQTAWSEKNTKLRSPLFYINPFRLSIRNLSKNIDEVALKKLIVIAIRRGLYENKLVNADDQIAHWRASGEYTTRDILAKIQEGDANNVGIIPLFDEKNIKQYVPSLHIHRDVVSGGNKNIAPSRGFGFVEFQHHTHALACLRELNNNPIYSKEYAIGGKHVALMIEKRKRNGKKRKIESAAVVDENTKTIDDNYIATDGSIRIPRLIVEFTVENKAKAKQQAEHKEKQQANQLKQRLDVKSDTTVTEPEKVRKSRGAIQREKKRLRQQEQQNDDGVSSDERIEQTNSKLNDGNTNAVVADKTTMSTSENHGKKVKVVPKKKPEKLDKDEMNFNHLVASYQQQAMGTISTAPGQEQKDAGSTKSKRRWFE
jgi:nucleolar protein 4